MPFKARMGRSASFKGDIGRTGPGTSIRIANAIIPSAIPIINPSAATAVANRKRKRVQKGRDTKETVKNKEESAKPPPKPTSAEDKKIPSKPCKSKKRRVVFSSEQVKPLNDWFKANINDPYPDPDVKESLASKAKISYEQVSNWFVNTRARRLSQSVRRDIRGLGSGNN